MIPSPPSSPARDGRRGIQSIETGARLLKALAGASTPLALGELASRAGMSPARAHPYLVSFIRVGLVRQCSNTGHYDLGPFTLQMGLISMQRLDTVSTALPLVERLSNRLGHSMAVAVLGSHGPTIIHITSAPYPVHINIRVGTVVSMVHSATGHVFAAWLPERMARHYIERETGDASVMTSFKPLHTDPGSLSEHLQNVRRQGLAHALDSPLPGMNVVSVPVFDHTGGLCMALTGAGPGHLLDADPGGAPAQALRACADALSALLGHRNQAPAS